MQNAVQASSKILASRPPRRYTLWCDETKDHAMISTIRSMPPAIKDHFWVLYVDKLHPDFRPMAVSLPLVVDMQTGEQHYGEGLSHFISRMLQSQSKMAVGANLPSGYSQASYSSYDHHQQQQAPFSSMNGYMSGHSGLMNHGSGHSSSYGSMQSPMQNLSMQSPMQNSMQNPMQSSMPRAPAPYGQPASPYAYQPSQPPGPSGQPQASGAGGGKISTVHSSMLTNRMSRRSGMMSKLSFVPSSHDKPGKPRVGIDSGFMQPITFSANNPTNSGISR